jgi:perosamine synthetase
VAAAIGLAQLEKIEEQIRGRTEVATWYQEYLHRCPGVQWQSSKEWASRVWFLFTLVIDADKHSVRNDIIPYLLEHGIDSRPVYYPLHSLPPYLDKSETGEYPVAEHVSRRGINLPTWAGMSREDVQYICGIIRDFIGR